MFRPVLFSDLKHYNIQTFRADLFAGLTVGVVALPLAMAFAIACGLPPERGHPRFNQGMAKAESEYPSL